MDRLGSYEILRELARTPHAITYSARQTGDTADKTGRFVVKRFDTESVGLLESVAAAQAFLERAAFQKKLADQGARHWPPIYEIGHPDDAYYITDLYPLTAEKVINRGAQVNAAGLHAVVWSVVRGLTELRETFRRAHGNLKLSNILINGDLNGPSAASAQVMLVDPSVEAHSARDRSADAFALGELIHQLVLRRPFKPARVEASDADDETPQPEPEWPVPLTANWTKLGDQGPQWLELCNWLLSPKPADRPNDLVEIAIALHRLTPKKKRRAPKWIALAAVPVLLAAVGVGLFYNTHSNVHAETIALHQQWFGQFEQGLNDPARQKRYANEEGLGAVVESIRTAQKQGVHFDVASDGLLSWSAYKNAGTALGIMQRSERELSPERWQRLGTTLANQRRYELRGWAQPAAYLSQLVAGVRPGPGVDLPAGIDRLLEASARMNSDALWLDENWPKFEADLAKAEHSGDRLLAVFAEYLRSAAGASLRLTDAGFDGLDGLKSRVPVAKDLARVVAAGWPENFGRDRLTADVESRLNTLNPSDGDIRQWLAAVDQYALTPLDPAAEPLAPLNASFKKLTDDISRQNFTEAERAEYVDARGKVEAKLQAFASARFVRKDVARAQGEIPLRASEIQRDLDALRKAWVRLDDPKLWVAFIDQPLPTGSDVLKQRWKAHVEWQRTRIDLLTKNVEGFKKNKAQSEQLRDLLSELDKQFPQVPQGLPEQFAATAFEKRESELRTLTKWAEPAAPASPTDAALPELAEFGKSMEAAGNGFVAWCGKLKDLTKDFPIARELLLPTDRPDEAWAGRDKDFWNDPLIRNLVKADLDRINALATVAKMSRADLVKAAAESESTEIALAAWRKLGQTPEGAPTWPSTGPELEAELTLRNHLGKLLNGLKNETDRKAPADDWRKEGPIRWRRFTNLALLASAGEAATALEQRLSLATRYRNAMLVTEPEVEKLDPAPRFNYALYIARITITDTADAVVRAASANLQRAIVDLKDRPELKDLSSRLGRLAEAEPMGADAKLLAPQSPETYTLPLRDAYTLKFVRVQAGGVRPFYLCTTELSLGQFIELMNAGGNWTIANTLLGNVSIPGGVGPTPQRGPRAWERPAAGNGPIDRFETWRYDTSAETAAKFVFATPLRQTRFNKSALLPEAGDNPKYDHPMQQMPAQAAIYAAALANCRLPTVREWLAAYEIERKAIADPAKLDWNLRDTTWRTQQDFASKEVPAQWPDADSAGVFWPKGQPRPSPKSSRASNDGALFFRVVASGSGTFQNLVGNVSELVCDYADAFDQSADRKSLEGIQRYCKNYGTGIMVIGGSALSPPELELLRPVPVNAVTEPYADVGVRLAFSAPARTIAERLKWFLDEQPYLAATANPEHPGE